MPTFTALNGKKIEEKFIHILESNSFYFRTDITNLPFVVASSRPTKNKGFCPA
jgi:hypothetical protein